VNHANLGGLDRGWNEIVVDGRGNAYVNGAGFDLVAGKGFAPGIVALADSYGRRLTAFNIAADGGLPNRRLWADLGDGVPDGICLDAEGAAWYGDVPNKRCVRVRAGGEVLQVIDLDRGCFACTLGSADNSTLFPVATEWRGPASAAELAGTGQVLMVAAPAPGRVGRRSGERGPGACCPASSFNREPFRSAGRVTVGPVEGLGAESSMVDFDVVAVCCAGNAQPGAGRLVRVLGPRPRRVVALPGRPNAVGDGPSGVWVRGAGGGVWHLDEDSLRVVATVAVRGGLGVAPGSVAVTSGACGSARHSGPPSPFLSAHVSSAPRTWPVRRPVSPEVHSPVLTPG
jgi:hypothetical protein